jgi:hypothetical protein
MLLLFRVEIITEFWLGNIRERDHLKDLGLDGKIMLEPILKDWNEWVCTVLFLLMIGTNGEILYTRL